LHEWDLQQQQQLQHDPAPQQLQQVLQQVGVLDQPTHAEVAQQRQQHRQQRQLDQAAAASSSKARIVVPAANGDGRHSTSGTPSAPLVPQQGAADAASRSRPKPKQRQRKQQQAQQQQSPGILGLWNT
jgi:16S rRNA G1207 methylase RsmC